MGEDWESRVGFVRGGRGAERGGGDLETSGRAEAVCVGSADFKSTAETWTVKQKEHLIWSQPDMDINPSSVTYPLCGLGEGPSSLRLSFIHKMGIAVDTLQ